MIRSTTNSRFHDFCKYIHIHNFVDMYKECMKSTGLLLKTKYIQSFAVAFIDVQQQPRISTQITFHSLNGCLASLIPLMYQMNTEHCHSGY